MEVGVAKICEDQDFVMLKNIINEDDGWSLDYDKQLTQVLTKSVENSNFKMVKIRTVFHNVCASDLYDILHDPEYRKKWDMNALECVDIGHLNPNNDVSYYALSVPPPLKNRDFVLQRSWLDTGQEQLILNHSVYHKDFPPRKGFIRAISHLTGFYISAPRQPRGCHFSYVTRTDPQGAIPAWIVNKATQIFAPKYVKLIEKAALSYSNWKLVHDPHFKPWYFPEQLTSVKIKIEDCVPSDVEIQANPVLRNRYKKSSSIKEHRSKHDSAGSGSTNKSVSADAVGEPKQPSQTSMSGNLVDSEKKPNSEINLNKCEEDVPKKNRILAFLNFAKSCTGRNAAEDVVSPDS